MFFILYEISSLIRRGASSIAASIDDARCKKSWEDSIKKGEWKSPTWVDRKGVERNICTNEIQITRRIDGDKVLTDMYGNPLRNFSKEERNKVFEHAKQIHVKGVTVVKWKGDGDPKCEGERFKDIKTGRILTTRKIGTNNDHVYFFMDATTGEYVRPTDYQYSIWKKCNTTEKGKYKARELLKKHFEDVKFQRDILNKPVDKFDNFETAYGVGVCQNEINDDKDYTIPNF